MRTKLALAAVLLAIAAGSFLAKGFLISNRTQRTDEGEGKPCQRIISVSPSITETLFALGLGDRVVGVTRFCLYPPEARQRTIIGGYFDPNYETILSLHPDLVVLRGENEQSVAGFEKLGLKTLVVRHNTIEGILDSMRTIGRCCGVEAEGERLASDLERQMREIGQRTAQLPRPRVLVVAERGLGSGRIENAYVAGSDGFINRMLELAGARNACPDTSVGFPQPSVEGILAMNPDVILDMISKQRQAGMTKEEILGDWQKLPDVEAVRKGRVYLVDDDYAFIPGPRFILTIKLLARLIHPEVEWPQ